MVATAVGTPATASPGRVSAPLPAFPARHGRHAADAAARPHRALEVHYVRELRTRADADPRSFRGRLPRWHQNSAHRELTSGLYAHNGKSWIWRYDSKTGRREPVREGTTSRVTWLDRDSYLTRTVPAILALAASRDVLRAHKVDASTFRRWVRIESLYAEQRTGRRIIVRARTIADVMEVNLRTVHRCRSAGRTLGLYATIYPGRMLRVREQLAARWAGSPQRGLAAESAFVIPREHAGITTVSCLHRGAAQGHFSDNPDAELTLTTQGEKERTSSASPNKSRRRKSPAWNLAKAVKKRLSWARHADPRDLLRPLSRFATGELCWTADDVVRHIDAVNRRRGWTAIHSPADLKAPPGAFLAFYLRDVDRDADHPRLDQFLEQERRNARVADQLRARELHDLGERCGREWCC